MGIEKCANCMHIDQLRKNSHEGACKGCNAKNNSKNWRYDTRLDEQTTEKGIKMTNEELFNIFLEKYLANVQKILPESYRTQQLKAGGDAANLVYIYEGIFLKTPFLEAITEATK